MTSPLTKKRKLDEDESKEHASQSLLKRFLQTPIAELCGDEMDTETLEAMSAKLQKLQKKIKKRIMKSIDFQNMKVPVSEMRKATKMRSIYRFFGR